MAIPELTFNPNDYATPSGAIHIDFDEAFKTAVPLETFVLNGSTREEENWSFAVGQFVNGEFQEITDISELSQAEQVGLADFTTNLETYVAAVRDIRLQAEQDYTDEELAAWAGINYARNPANQPLFSNLNEANQRFMQLAEAVHVIFVRLAEDKDANG